MTVDFCPVNLSTASPGTPENCISWFNILTTAIGFESNIPLEKRLMESQAFLQSMSKILAYIAAPNLVPLQRKSIAVQ